MAYVRGELVPTPGEEAPYKVVVWLDGSVYSQTPVSSPAEGDVVIDKAMKSLQELAQKDADL